MRLKLYLAASLLALLLCSFLLFKLSAPPISQPATLSDGSILHVQALTYGTNHFVGGTLARMVSKLPQSWQASLTRLAPRLLKVRSMRTTEPEFRMWFDCVPATTNSAAPDPFLELTTFLATDDGFVSGEQESLYPLMSGIESVGFKSWPRRGHRVQLHLFQNDQKSKLKTHLVIAIENALYEESATTWQAESLPVTKMAGDVEVTMLDFTTGYGIGTTQTGLPGGKRKTTYDLRKEGVENHSVCTLRIVDNISPSNVWEVTYVTLSDASGNSVKSRSMSWKNESQQAKFSPSLWPNETAWKVACEIKRSIGFATNELLTFKGVPVPSLNQSNAVSIITNFNGASIALTHIVRKPAPGDSWSSSDLSEIGLTNSTLPESVHLNLVSIKAHGKEVAGSGSSTGANERQYFVQSFPEDAKTVDITMSLQKSRTVEFLVKPEIAKEEKP
ncbi:MAG: hypothetical protein JWM68_280 [Verrucomicrobiales bacterium]|nr:hypothetical protein [Verrucomicrobiales bacterium]